MTIPTNVAVFNSPERRPVFHRRAIQPRPFRVHIMAARPEVRSQLRLLQVLDDGSKMADVPESDQIASDKLAQVSCLPPGHVIDKQDGETLVPDEGEQRRTGRVAEGEVHDVFQFFSANFAFIKVGRSTRDCD